MNNYISKIIQPPSIMNYNGHVLYSNDKIQPIPFAVVSKNYERNATTTEIPSKLKKFIVEIEDKRFYNHRGIDLKGILRASIENFRAGKIVQGGSTITQQLARHFLRDSRRTVWRKLREAVKAIEIERRYSKTEILDLYFQNIYFGGKLFGLRSASLFYFKKEPKNLSEIQQLELLTILRGPNYYLSQLSKTQNRFQRINLDLFSRKIITKNRFVKNQKVKVKFEKHHLQVFNDKTIPFIVKAINDNNKSIFTTIDYDIQKIANSYVLDSKYPVSVICISKSRVLAVASTYGTSHPFLSKTNVGSTLKPFLYTHLRQNGLDENQTFKSFSNSLNWSVREIQNTKSELTISEALFQSNNNAFINACVENGLPKSLGFLSQLLGKNHEEFFPSSILGATKSGISLYELANAYSKFFHVENLTIYQKECLCILNKIACEKLGFVIDDVFIKTGTTNDNQDRFVLSANADLVLAISRGENPINDYSKEGNFISSIKNHFLKLLIPSQKGYKWI